MNNSSAGTVSIFNNTNNIIGGTLVSVIPQNTFSGNEGYGVAITGLAHDNRVFRSFIGTQILGVNALGNNEGGVLIAGDACGNLIGLACDDLLGSPARFGSRDSAGP